jgi:uncharacterized protein
MTTPLDDLLGRSASLRVLRLGPPGAFLAIDDGNEETLLLPRNELPEGTREGDELAVFVYLDSEDRPIATLQAPKVERDEVAFLEVTDLTRFGAFVDWGLPKELLVPFAEQTRELRIGDRHPIGLLLDDTGRLAGTMRVSELLADVGDFELDEWVDGEAWRQEPELGLFVIVERSFVGLLPAQEPHSLGRGERASFRVTHVHGDGKIELSLRGHAHEEIEEDTRRIVEVLSRPGAPRISDRARPEEIRARFGLSKKSFKRAVGRLLKEGTVTIDRDGIVVLVRGGARGPNG